MTNKKIKEKLKYLEHYKIPDYKKIEFIEKLYKLANISFTEYIKNGHIYINK